MDNKRGFSAMEVMLALPLSVFLALTLFQSFTSTSKAALKLGRIASTSSQIDRAMEQLERSIQNTVTIIPYQGLASANDGLYPGLAGVNGNATAVSGCDYVSNDSERYSILRYTSSDARYLPNAIKNSWNENQVEAQDLHLELTESLEEGRSAVFHKGMAWTPETVSEILLTDLEQQGRRLYTVTGVSFPVSNDRVLLELERTQTLSRQRDSRLSLEFASGSIIQAVKTQIVCINNGKLVQISEFTNRKRTLLNFQSDALFIRGFSVKYLDSKPSQRLTASQFFIYPYGDLGKIPCIDTIQITLEVQSRNGKESGSKTFERRILLPNIHSHRKQGC